MKNSHIKYKASAFVKMRLGIQVEYMRNFAVDDNFSYSLYYLESFNYLEMMESNSDGKDYCASK